MHLVRQPVFDARLRVVGYQLVFRPDDSVLELGAPIHPERATAEVITATYTEFGLAAIVGDRTPFVTITTPFLTGELDLPFEPGSTILTVSARLAASPAALPGLEALAAAGHRIMIDLDAWPEMLERMLFVAEIAALPCAGVPAERVRVDVEALRRPGLKLLARDIDATSVFTACVDAGVDLFHGDLLAHPTSFTGHRFDPQRLACLDLIAALGNPDSTTRDIEERLRRDPALTLRVLRMVNSAAAGLSRRVSSLREAIVLVGRNTLRAWVLIMALTDISPGSAEQLTQALTRARMCETMSARLGVQPEVAFTVGVLSAMDSLVDVPLHDLVASLPLDEQVAGALLRREGDLGALLSTVLAYEQASPSGGWAMDVTLEDARRAYIEAAAWASRTCGAVLTTEAQAVAAG